MRKQMVAGLRVDAERERVSSASSEFYSQNAPPMVVLRQLGREAVWLTPSEARVLADILNNAADEVEPRS